MAAVPLNELVKGEEYKILKISDDSKKTLGRFYSRTKTHAAFTNTRRGSHSVPMTYNAKRYRFFPSAYSRKINAVSRLKKLPPNIQGTLKQYGGMVPVSFNNLRQGRKYFASRRNNHTARWHC